MSKPKFQKGDLVEVVSPKKYQGKRGVIKNMVKVGSRAGYHIPEIDKTGGFYSYELKKCVEMKFKERDKVVFTPEAKQWLIDNGYWGTDKGDNLYRPKIDPNKVYTISNVFSIIHSYELEGVDYIEASDEDLLPAIDSEFHRTDRIKKWVDICNEYLKEFCDKHDYAYHPEDWIGDEVGGIIEIADMFVTMDNIRYDVDNEIPVEKFSDWYWNSVEHSELGLKYMNYPSYCKGAPDPYTQEQIQSIREGQMRIRKAKEDLRKAMDEIGGDFSKLLF